MSALHDQPSVSGLTHVTMGLGWDPARPDRYGRRRPDIDLNAAAMLFSGPRFVDVAYHQQLTSQDGAVRHLGDSTTGQGDGDNETIAVDLTRLYPTTTTVLFIVTCYTGQRFNQIDNAFARLVDDTTGHEIARLDLSTGRTHSGMVLGKLHRRRGVWDFAYIGEAIWAEHPVEALPQLDAYLG
ncbi:TerD family protein [Nocardia thailandica]|uniref:TerD family protein n=1 Tax=Nocardia thailandica TaxID=257275 RepID=UPI0002E204D4|nr:TerD family protein [Nocardia thailandica]